MTLEPDLVSFALGLTSDELPDTAECEKLARLLGNREELLAYLFTRTGLLRKHDDLLSAMKELADAHGTHVVTQRPAVGAPTIARDLIGQMSNEALSAADRDIAAIRHIEKLEALSRQQALYSDDEVAFTSSPERWFSA